MTTKTLRRNFIFPLLSLGALASTSACCLIPDAAPDAPVATLTEISMPVVTGSVTYREKMAAPPGSVVRVVLQDTSLADVAAVDVADWKGSLDEGGVPKQFTLHPDEPLNPRQTYSVRATIRGPEGDLLWTTDTMHRVPVDVASAIDMGELVMVKVEPYVPAVAAPPVEGEWIIETVGGAAVVGKKPPTIAFSEEGRVSGFGGCNRFMGGYSQKGVTLSFEPIAMTKMACLNNAANKQESAIGGALTGEATYVVDGDGMLTLTGADGTVITAKKALDLSLAGTTWVVGAMGGTGVVAGSEPQITFTEDGQINGTTGCNRFFGSYEQDGAALTFSGVGTTRMACSAEGVMAQETKFTSILSGAATAAIDGAGKLTITGAKGIGFVAEKPGSADGADPAILSGGEWVVEDINRTGVIDNSYLTINFGADGSVSGSTNCNTFRGTYTATATAVTFSPLATTRMACAAEALGNQEAKFMAALSGEMTWRITGDDALELTGEGGRRVLARR